MESLIITLYIFSVLVVVQWEINSSHPSFAEIITLLGNHSNTEQLPDHGYRGFIVELNHDGQTVKTYTVGRKKYVELERKLLESAPEELVQRVGATVYRMMNWLKVDIFSNNLF